MSNIVAIVGRPNVGKSTLFNRLIQRRDAIVDSVAGVTRDRHYGKSDWNGKEFSVIDTGGYIDGSEDVFEAEIRRQVELALEEASVVLFVLDLQAGLTEFDKIISELLRKTEKPVVYCVNKVDNSMLELEATEFYGLGIEKYHTIMSWLKNASRKANWSGFLNFPLKTLSCTEEALNRLEERLVVLRNPELNLSTTRIQITCCVS